MSLKFSIPALLFLFDVLFCSCPGQICGGYYSPAGSEWPGWANISLYNGTWRAIDDGRWQSITTGRNIYVGNVRLYIGSIEVVCDSGVKEGDIYRFQNPKTRDSNTMIASDSMVYNEDTKMAVLKGHIYHGKEMVLVGSVTFDLSREFFLPGRGFGSISILRTSLYT